jgi:hypothetical protein
MSVFVSNTSPDTVELKNTEVAFVTLETVGIANVAPEHTLDVGSNLFIEDSSPNVLVVNGNLVATWIDGDGSLLKNVVMTANLDLVSHLGNVVSIPLYFSNGQTGFTTISNVGIANVAPIHTLDVGSNLYVNDDLLFVRGDTKTIGNLWVQGNITSVSMIGDGTLVHNVGNRHDLMEATRRGNSTPHVVEFRNNRTSLVTGPQIGIANSSPQNNLDVGENFSVNLNSSNVLIVRGTVEARGFIGDGNLLANVVSRGTFDSVVNNGNTTSNTVIFTNPQTAFVTFSNVGIQNTDPQNYLNIGANTYINDSGVDEILTVNGNVYMYYLKGDGRYLRNLPTCDDVATWNYITNIGNTTAQQVEFLNPDTSFITHANIGIANEFPVHTLDIGSNIYMEANADTSIWTSGSVVCNYIIGDGSQLTNLSINLQQTVNNGNLTTNIVHFSNLTESVIVASNIKANNDVLIDSWTTSSIRIGGVKPTDTLHSPGSSNIQRISIGSEAGQLGQATRAIALGTRAGNQGQGEEALAIGAESGEVLQGDFSISLGDGAATQGQNTHATAIGYRAGISNQSMYSVAIGINAGSSYQQSNSVSIGEESGFLNQGVGSVAIGALSGKTNQGTQVVSIGRESGFDEQSAQAVAIGLGAGMSFQSNGAVSIGNNAGQFGQNAFATAIGSQSGQSYQNTGSISLGILTGELSQDTGSVAMGTQSGQSYQSVYSIASGYRSAREFQGSNSISLGEQSGETYQNNNSITIGFQSGQSYQNTHSVAIGYQAGQSFQGSNSITLGIHAGQSYQNNGSVSIGIQAGQSYQNVYSVSIGYQTGQYLQNSNGIALGIHAGQFSQNNDSISIGIRTGQSYQNMFSTAIGFQSGQSFQSSNSIALGIEAGQISQNNGSITIGALAGQCYQGDTSISMGIQAGQDIQQSNSIAIGYQSGELNQNSESISLGIQSGQSYQNVYSVALGYQAGQSFQDSNSIAIGYQSGNVEQNSYSISIGFLSGQTHQNVNSIAVGHRSGQTTQDSNSISLGSLSGRLNQENESIAIGKSAGEISQGIRSVALGLNSGMAGQNTMSVAIGYQSGMDAQSVRSVALGSNAGSSNQGSDAVAIGYGTGVHDQGDKTIAIGTEAASVGQGDNSIVIGHKANVTTSNSIAIGSYASITTSNTILFNATGQTINPARSGLFVTPLRRMYSPPYSTVMLNTNDDEIISLSKISTTSSGETHIQAPLIVNGVISSLTSGDITVDKNIIRVANNNTAGTLDMGVIFRRAGSNVAYGYDESTDEFFIAYTTDTQGQTTFSNITTEDLKVHLYGPLEVKGNISAGYDTDIYSYLGKSKIGYVGYADAAGFSHIDSAQYAFGQLPSGETFVNTGLDGIYFRSDDANLAKFDTLSNFYVNNTFSIGADLDFTSHIHRSAIGVSSHLDNASFSHLDNNSGVGYALRQDSVGVTYINSKTGQDIKLRNNNVDVATIDASGIMLHAPARLRSDGGPILAGNLYLSNTSNYVSFTSGVQYDGSLDRTIQINAFTSSIQNTIASRDFRGDTYFGNVYASSNIGIGTTSPQQKLQIEGGCIRLRSGANFEDICLTTLNTSPAVSFSEHLVVNGNVFSTGTVTTSESLATSDIRLKSNIVKIENSLTDIERLNGYTFEMKGSRQTGMIAQEVMNVLPSAVTSSSDGYYGLAYGNLVGFLVETIKELKKEINTTRERLKLVRERNTSHAVLNS